MNKITLKPLRTFTFVNILNFFENTTYIIPQCCWLEVYVCQFIAINQLVKKCVSLDCNSVEYLMPRGGGVMRQQFLFAHFLDNFWGIHTVIRDLFGSVAWYLSILQRIFKLFKIKVIAFVEKKSSFTEKKMHNETERLHYFYQFDKYFL